jgi:hypothetical protein
MLKGLMHNIVLRIQARTGVTSTFFIGSAIAACALLVVFVFLCVTGYAWLSVQLGAVFGGLAMAGVFLLVALVGLAVASNSRRQAKQRAILERAAQAQGPLKLLDPKVLSVAMQAGRALGWQRVVPVALLGFLAAQWVQQARQRNSGNKSM